MPGAVPGGSGEALSSVGVRTLPGLWLPRAGGFSAAAGGDRCWWDAGQETAPAAASGAGGEGEEPASCWGGGFCPSQGTPRSRKPTWPGNPMCKGQQRGLVGLQVNFSSTLWREELRERSPNHLLLGLSGAGSQGCVGAGTARFGAAPPAAHAPMGSAAPCCTAGSPRDGGRGCGAAPHRGSGTSGVLQAAWCWSGFSLLWCHSRDVSPPLCPSPGVQRLVLSLSHL